MCLVAGIAGLIWPRVGWLMVLIFGVMQLAEMYP